MRDDARDIDVRLLTVTKTISGHSNRILAAMAVGAAILATVALVAPRRYSSQATFAPHARTLPASLSGLAGTLGVDLSSASDPTESPAFYVDLIRSPTVLADVVDSAYAHATPQSRDVAAIYGVHEENAALRREEAITRLRDHVRAFATLKTGMVTFVVTAPTPSDAYSLTTAILARTSRFSIERRQRRARADYEFSKQRVRAAADSLRHAEDRLQAFLAANRRYSDASVVKFEADRLQRDVTMQQQIYTSLAEAAERALVEQLRSTPMITAIETPEPAAQPDPRGLIPLTFVGATVGAILWAFVMFLGPIVRASRSRFPDTTFSFRVATTDEITR